MKIKKNVFGKKENKIILGRKICLQEEEIKSKESWVEIIRVGDWRNSFKNFQVTKQILLDFVKNFEDNVLRLSKKELQFNYSHRSNEKAAGWIKQLEIQGRRLRGLVQWTPEAVKKIQDQEFRFVSAEIEMLREDQENQEVIPNVLLGAALTNIPFVQGLKPLKLSEKTGISEDNIFYFCNNNPKMETFKKLLSTLQAKENVSLDEVNLLKTSMAYLSDEEKEEVEATQEVEKIEEKATKNEAEDKEKLEAKIEEEKEEKEEKEKELSNLKSKIKTLSNSDDASKMAQKLDLAQKALSDQQKELDEIKSERRKEKHVLKVKELSEKGIILPKDADATVNLLMDLSSSKAEKWIEHLSGMPVRVDFSEKGTSKDLNNINSDAKDAQVIKLAKEMNIKTKKDLGECMEEVMEQLGMTE